MPVDSNAPYVIVTPAQTSDLAWRCTKILHMTKEAGGGRHNIFIFLKIAGRVIYSGPSIQYGWDGQHDDEKQPPKALDKKPPDPSTDIAIEKGMHVWFEVKDTFPSDRVSNLHAEMINEYGEWGHHNYAVTMELLQGSVVAPPVVTEPALTLESVFHYVQSVDLRVKALEAK